MKKNIIISVLIILIDQITKYFVETNLYQKQIEIIDNVFAFTYVQNRGGAWGIMSNFSVLFLILVPIIVIFICKIVSKSKNNLEITAWYMIIGGALGNYIDRITKGYVVDFLDFYIWPVFNIADIFVVVGCILLIINSLKNDINKHKITK